MAYKYLCKTCKEEFFAPQPNINQRCAKCGKYAFLDWGHREGDVSES